MKTMTITRRADDKKSGMTLAEVRALIDEADRAGMVNARLEVVVGWRGQVRKATVTG